MPPSPRILTGDAAVLLTDTELHHGGSADLTATLPPPAACFYAGARFTFLNPSSHALTLAGPFCGGASTYVVPWAGGVEVKAAPRADGGGFEFVPLGRAAGPVGPKGDAGATGPAGSPDPGLAAELALLRRQVALLAWIVAGLAGTLPPEVQTLISTEL